LATAVACEDREPPAGGEDAEKSEAEAPAKMEAAALAPDREALRTRAAAVFKPLPTEVANPNNPFTEEKIALGRILFYDPRFSKNQDISCNSCHTLERYGVDGEPTSFGHRRQRGERNSPTVYHAALHIAQFWDGRAADVEEQAKGPILNPVEMAMPSAEHVMTVLKSVPGYEPMFAAAFPDDPDPIDIDNGALAIAAFERRLLTPSPFDAFLEGDATALGDEQLRGLQLFLDTGCTTCHNGVAIGGAMFQKLGLVRPYPTFDPGRAAVTGNEADKQFFKVPSLRNIVKTGPYFHDGSISTLDEAIETMAAVQLGRDLTPDQVAGIRTFLESLTGEIDEQYIAKPEIPASGPTTPKPDPT
jgi:cytochrome c peroxidase